MDAYILMGLAAAMAGCTCLYLASPNQRWREAAWSKWPACVAGGLLWGSSWLALRQSLQALTATYVFLTVLMLLLALLPYVGALMTLKKKDRP